MSKDLKRPNFTKKDAKGIAERQYGIKAEVQELPSERDRNYHLRSDSGDEYILKIAAESEKKEFLECQNEAIKHINGLTSQVRCPHIIKTMDSQEIASIEDKDGKKHFVRLLSYLKGRVLAHVNPHSSELLRELGRSIGAISRTLESFSHPAARREFYWDIKNAKSVIEEYREFLDDSEKREIVDQILKEFEKHVIPALDSLRKSVIYNDANDYNVIVNDLDRDGNREIGVVDFGDMVFSYTIFELAVGVAYAILGKADPISTAAQVIGGYHSDYPLTKSEIKVLFYLICTRLAMSVAIAAYQQKLEPDNEYLIISQKQVWDTLVILRNIHPRFATYVFRHACELEPCPNSSMIVNWLYRNQEHLGSILDINLKEEPIAILDLSVGSLDIEYPEVLSDINQFTDMISKVIASKGVEVGVGRYDEPRLMYTSDQYTVPSDMGPEMRTVHLAIDLFLQSGTSIYAPIDGKIHSFKDTPGPLDNGPTIVLEHEITEIGLTFFTLYAHLSRDSIDDLMVGKPVKKGEEIARVGTYPTNGGWPSHLHFQLIIDMFDEKGDFKGVALHKQREVWLSISPNPNVILGIPEDRFPEGGMTDDEITNIRKERIGRNLSTHYKKPLKIAQGFMQYLYDDIGRKYLDARNNVAHVGHCHPSVVKALQKQAAILNTNTRYLHDNLVLYAKRLCSRLPEPLRVCFFVNSGSEANELALRLARTHTKHTDLIVIDGAYHGNTGALVDISPYKFDGPGGKGPPPYVHKVRKPDTFRGAYGVEDPKAGEKYAEDIHEAIKQLEKKNKSLTGFICESLMASGGQIVFPPNYLQEAFKYVRQAGGICIVDEVQVGFGRVGTHFWGFETQNVVPDIITMGKSIGNGHPLGAVITTPEIAASFDNGMEFFSTTGGNTVSCAVGLAVLDVIEEERLQQNALDIGGYLLNRLRQLAENHQIIGDVRGMGLFIGIELVRNRTTLEPANEEATYIYERMKDFGILISTDGKDDNVLTIKPPLVFTKENAEFLVNTLDKILKEDPVRLSD